MIPLLKQLDNNLATEFDAYGWPPTLTDEVSLTKQVALNTDECFEQRRFLAG